MNRREASLDRSGVVAAGVLVGLVPLLLVSTGAREIQLVAATVGALLATGGVALLLLGWPRRRCSDVHHLLAAVGFFLFCAGVVAMLAGVGLYH